MEPLDLVVTIKHGVIETTATLVEPDLPEVLDALELLLRGVGFRFVALEAEV